MRVTNDTLRQVFLSSLEAAQRRAVETQEQVSTGRRVNSPADDPVAAGRIAQLDASLARLDQYRANGVFARNQLGLEEEALAGVIDNLQRIRELAVQANNDSLSSSDRLVVAKELRERRDALLALANSSDADGRYLFAGYSENTQPFTNGAGGAAVYNGDQGQRVLQLSDARFVAINDSGAQIFQKIPAGNGTFTLAAAAANTGSGVLGAGTVVNPSAWVRDTYAINFLTPTTYEVRDSGGALIASGAYAPNQAIAFGGIEVGIDGAPAGGDSFTVTPSANRDVFATVDSLIAALESSAGNPTARAQLHNKVGQLLVDLDQGVSHMGDARAEIGARLRTVDEEGSLSEAFGLQLATTLSDLRDLDYAEALSRLTQQMFGLEAAQQAYARTQGLSLFKYL
jgi:flagellar hook-associated protein 3 FlgL